MAVPGAVALRGVQKPVQTRTCLSASAVGAGTGAQAASDLTQGSATAESPVALVRGLAPAADTLMARSRVPNLDELRGIEARFDSAVDQSAARLSPEAADRLADDIANSFGFHSVAAPENEPQGLSCSRCHCRRPAHQPSYAFSGQRSSPLDWSECGWISRCKRTSTWCRDDAQD